MTIHEQLLQDDWRTFNCPFREKRTCYAKSFKSYAKCNYNKPKNKQIEVYHYPSDRISGLNLPESWSVELHGELPDEHWIRMSVEGLQTYDEIITKVHDLLHAWNHLVSIIPPSPESE